MEKLLLNDSMNDYLTFSKYINGNDVRIVSKANEFKQKYTNEISLIKAVYEFVRDEIKHSWDIQDKRVTKSAVISDAVTSLGKMLRYSIIAALVRACGIPAGICYQRLTLGDTPDTGFCIHALNAVYIKSMDKWIRLDARGNKKGVDAQFDLQTEKLAFVVRTNMGEADYRTIYAKPSDKLMNVLENNTDAIYMYLNCLPDNIF